MKPSLLPGACLLLPVLAGCALTVPLEPQDVQRFSNGLGAAEVGKIVGSATRVERYQFTFDGKPYLAEHYRLATPATIATTWMCKPICYPTTRRVFNDERYVLLYEGAAPRLSAWGTVEDFRRKSRSAGSGGSPYALAYFGPMVDQK